MDTVKLRITLREGTKCQGTTLVVPIRQIDSVGL